MSYVISAIYSTLLTHLSNDYRYSIVQFSLQDNHTFLVSHHFLLFPDFLDVIHFLKCLVYLKLPGMSTSPFSEHPVSLE